MSKISPGTSVIIPTYDSALSLPELITRLHPVLETVAGEYEVILVNDGSRDGTWHVIRELATANSWIRAVDLMRNYGQHNALLCGIRRARYSVCITMDDDLQHPPEAIPTLLARLTQACDVVYATPKDEQHGLWRNLASKLTKLSLQKTMGANIAQYVSAFRAFKTEIRDAFSDFHGPFVSIDVLLTWGSNRFGVVGVDHQPRRHGRSNYTVGKLASHALNMLTGFSAWPLRVASLIGFLFTLFGAAVLVFVLTRYFFQGGSVPGFPFLASVIAIFSGAQLFALGVIGEYLARIHLRSMEKPSYVIRTTTTTPLDSAGFVTDGAAHGALWTERDNNERPFMKESIGRTY